MWDYTEKVKEYFLNPRNVGVIEDADGVGEVGSLACGDALTLYLKVDENERITDAKFKTFGCASAIASSSALTEIIKGLPVSEAEKITNEDIVRFLGGLPRQKMHCSVMGREALEMAIADYRGEAEKAVEGTIVCECFGVTDREIERAIRENRLSTIEDVTNFTKAGGGCEKCHEKIQRILDDINGTWHPPAGKPGTMTNIEKIKRIEATLDREIRPSLQQDGGDVVLVDVDGNTVYVRLQGTCAGCRISHVTLKDTIEAKLRELVHPNLFVKEA
jgi:NifU-like protein